MPGTGDGNHARVTFLTALVVTVTATVLSVFRPDVDDPPPPKAERPGTIVPLYSVPNSPAWTALIDAKRRYPDVPVIAIVNPPEGISAAERDQYRHSMAGLRAAGVIQIGYLTSSYTRRSMEEMGEEIIRTQRDFPKLDGLFIDEMSTEPDHQDYYQEVSGAARDAGLDFLVGNPGTATQEGFLRGVDVLVTRENTGPPPDCRRADWQVRHHRRHFAMLSYGVPSLDRELVRGCAADIGWLYLTDDALPNPWDTVPGYLPELLAALNEAG